MSGDIEDGLQLSSEGAPGNFLLPRISAVQR